MWAKSCSRAGTTQYCSDRISDGDWTFGEIAKGQAKSGDMDGALRTAERISSPDTSLPVFEEIAMTQVKAEDMEGARRTLRAAVSATYRMLESISQTPALEPIAVAQVRTGDVEGALRTAERVKAAHRRASVLASIAKALAKTDRAAGQGPTPK